MVQAGKNQIARQQGELPQSVLAPNLSRETQMLQSRSVLGQL